MGIDANSAIHQCVEVVGCRDERVYKSSLLLKSMGSSRGLKLDDGRDLTGKLDQKFHRVREASPG